MKNGLLKLTIGLLTVVFCLTVATACSTDTVEKLIKDQENGMPQPPSGGGGGNNSGTNDTSGDDLEAFDVAFDTSALTETETVPTDESDTYYEDFIENSTFNQPITITYSEGAAEVSGSVKGVTVTSTGAYVTVVSESKKVEYILKGSASAGCFKLYSEKKAKITLSGLTLTNPTGAAINIQKGKTSGEDKRMFIVADKGTANTLTDGTTYTTTDDEDMKGVIFNEGKLIMGGSGTLTVNAKGKNGICSDDYVRFRAGSNISIYATANNGVKANDGIIIGGGVLNIDVSSTAGKGLSSDAFVQIDGGRTYILTSGGGEYDSDDNDVTACAGIKADTYFTMNGGTLGIKSTGNGGKGISADTDININGGNIKVITTGTQYIYNNYDTSPKGIKADNNVNISGGNVMVRTSGGENSEGIESKNIMTISGGEVLVSAYDDCLNASKHISISGGSVYAYSSSNDGIDSNGTLSISGGIVVCSGTTVPEEGIDCDSNTFTVTGGTIIGIGGASSTPTASVTTQPVIIYGGSGSAGTYIALNAADGTNILSYKIPRAYNQMTLLVSSPSLSKGSTYTLQSGGSVSGGTTFHGLTTGGTWSGGSQLTSASLSSTVTTINVSGSGQGGGGGQPDGQPGGGGKPGGGRP